MVTALPYCSSTASHSKTVVGSAKVSLEGLKERDKESEVFQIA